MFAFWVKLAQSRVVLFVEAKKHKPELEFQQQSDDNPFIYNSFFAPLERWIIIQKESLDFIDVMRRHLNVVNTLLIRLYDGWLAAVCFGFLWKLCQ